MGDATDEPRRRRRLAGAVPPTSPTDGVDPGEELPATTGDRGLRSVSRARSSLGNPTTPRPPRPVPSAPDPGPSVRIEGGSSKIADLELRSPDPAVCPFLRSEGPDGRLARPIERPDEANRCDAFGEPRPQSSRQQELACLTDAHGECARYLRGSLVAADRMPPGHQRRGLTTPILAAVLLLVATSAASLAFIAARGGLDLPVAPLATTAAIVGGTTAPTLDPASPEPTIDVTLPPASPDLEPTPVPAATRAPTATPAPTPRSDRYARLEPCPDKPDCWIYTVRAGDNLSSIASYFGIPLETVYSLNPELRTESLQPGRLLVLPPPTR